MVLLVLLSTYPSFEVHGGQGKGVEGWGGRVGEGRGHRGPGAGSAGARRGPTGASKARQFPWQAGVGGAATVGCNAQQQWGAMPQRLRMRRSASGVPPHPHAPEPKAVRMARQLASVL